MKSNNSGEIFSNCKKFFKSQFDPKRADAIFLPVLPASDTDCYPVVPVPAAVFARSRIGRGLFCPGPR